MSKKIKHIGTGQYGILTKNINNELTVHWTDNKDEFTKKLSAFQHLKNVGILQKAEKYKDKK